jgi:hypothetical protein
VALLYWHAGHLTARFGGFWPGQTVEQQQAKLLRAQVASGLSELPTPKHEYSIQLPEGSMDLDDGGKEDSLVEDAADRKTRLASEKKAEEDATLKLMSQPLQRGLPRPEPKAVAAALAPKGAPANAAERADQMVQAELVAMVRRRRVLAPDHTTLHVL